MNRGDGSPEPTPAQREAANERGNPPIHEQHPLSAEEQRLAAGEGSLPARRKWFTK